MFVNYVSIVKTSATIGASCTWSTQHARGRTEKMSVLVSEKTLSLYEQLLALPEHVVGEIINGRLYTQPRPAGPHALASAALEGELYGPYQKGRGGPGGWWILMEPELHFVRDTEVLVPDFAGWRR